VSKDTIKLKDLNVALTTSKKLAKDYSKFPVVKLQVWRDLREKQKLIKERLHENVKGS